MRDHRKHNSESTAAFDCCSVNFVRHANYTRIAADQSPQFCRPRPSAAHIHYIKAQTARDSRLGQWLVAELSRQQLAGSDV